MYSWHAEIMSTYINGSKYQKLAHCTITDRELFLCDDGILCVYDNIDNCVHVMDQTTKVHAMFKKGAMYTLLDIAGDIALQYVIDDAIYKGMTMNDQGTIEHRFVCHVKHAEYDEFCKVWNKLCPYHVITHDYGNELCINIWIIDQHLADQVIKVI